MTVTSTKVAAALGQLAAAILDDGAPNGDDLLPERSVPFTAGGESCRGHGWTLVADELWCDEGTANLYVKNPAGDTVAYRNVALPASPHSGSWNADRGVSHAM